MATLQNLTVKLLGDASSLTGALRSSRRAIGQLGAVVGKVGLGAAALGAVGGAAITALGNAARNNIDEMSKLASNLGVTVTEVQELKIAADLSGISFNTLSRGIQRLARNAGDVLTKGTKAATVAFERLGISAAELRTLGQGELFRRSIEELAKIENRAERASVANDLFGRSWLTLNPLIENAAATFRETQSLIRDLDLGLGSAGNATEAFNDNLTLLGALGVAVRDKVFAQLAPQLAQISGAVLQLAKDFIAAQGGGTKFAQTLITGVVGGIRTLIGWSEKLKPTIKFFVTAFEVLSGILNAAGTFAGGIGAAAGAALNGNLSGAGRILLDLPSDAVDAFRGQDQEQLGELEQQTQLLRDILRKDSPTVFG